MATVAVVVTLPRLRAAAALSTGARRLAGAKAHSLFVVDRVPSKGMAFCVLLTADWHPLSSAGVIFNLFDVSDVAACVRQKAGCFLLGLPLALPPSPQQDGGLAPPPPSQAF